MGTYNPNDKSTYNLLRGLRGLRGVISTVITGVISTLNLQVGFRVLGSGFLGFRARV